MLQTIRAIALSSVLLLAATAAAKTVGIAPLSTGSAEEYEWIGPALADALSLRIHEQDGLNGLTLRQVNAAMRHDNIKLEQTVVEGSAYKLGRQLGADVLLVGSYNAKWPDIELVIKVVDPQGRKLLNTAIISGGLDNLFDVEARVAKTLAVELGAEKPNVVPGAFGTDVMRAWRSATLGFQIINWQSLSPRAADPNAPLKLPKSAIEQAKRYFDEASKYDPTYGDAWAGLGVTQALLGDIDSAWRAFGKATAQGFGHHPTAVLGASFVRMRQGRFDDAASILKSAIDRHGGFLHARGYLGQLYNHLGRNREALSVWKSYVEVVPKQPWVLAQQGYTKSKLKDHIGAIADTIAAVDLIPDSPSLLLQLASRYIDAGKLIGAEDALTHAMKMNPENSTIHVRLGYVYLLQDKVDLAIPITEKALVDHNMGKSQRNEAYAHINLTRAYGRKGDLDRAFEHLERAKALGAAPLEEVNGDPKLRDLRDDPRYKQIMQ